MAESATLVLYSTLGCHLCEQAETLLQSLPLSAPLPIDVVDISDDDTLLQRYGTRIPVLGWEETSTSEVSGTYQCRELDWPFDAAAVLAFLTCRSP